MIGAHVAVGSECSYMIVELSVVEHWPHLATIVLTNCHKWHEPQRCILLLFVVGQQPAVLGPRFQLFVELTSHGRGYRVLSHKVRQVGRCSVRPFRPSKLVIIMDTHGIHRIKGMIQKRRGNARKKVLVTEKGQSMPKEYLSAE